MTLRFDKSLLLGSNNPYLIALLPRLKEKRVQNFTTLALTLVTFSIFAVFAISPTVGTITDLQKQIEDNKFVSNQLQQKITALSLLQDNYLHMQGQLPAVFSAIPTTPDITLFLGQLQALAVISGATVERVQTLPVDLSATGPGAFYSSFSFAIDVDGSAESTQQFLKNLTSLSRLVTIEAISYGKNTRLATTYLLSIRGAAYFQGK